MPDKRSAGRVMSDLAQEMKQSIAMLCGPRTWHDNRKSWLAAGARKAGISYRQAKAFFYQETVNPRSDAVEKVRAATRGKDDSPGTLAGRLRRLMDRQQELDREIAALASVLHRDIDLRSGSARADEGSSREEQR